MMPLQNICRCKQYLKAVSYMTTHMCDKKPIAPLDSDNVIALGKHHKTTKATCSPYIDSTKNLGNPTVC